MRHPSPCAPPDWQELMTHRAFHRFDHVQERDLAAQAWSARTRRARRGWSSPAGGPPASSGSSRGRSRAPPCGARSPGTTAARPAEAPPGTPWRACRIRSFREMRRGCCIWNLLENPRVRKNYKANWTRFQAGRGKATVMIDLHSHTTASDGQHEPEELLAMAAAAGVTALAVTDHDTVAGLARCAAAANERGIELVPGIELSAFLPGAREVHVLGHFVDRDDQELGAFSEKLRHERNERMERHGGEDAVPGLPGARWRRSGRSPRTRSWGGRTSRACSWSALLLEHQGGVRPVPGGRKARSGGPLQAVGRRRHQTHPRRRRNGHPRPPGRAPH